MLSFSFHDMYVRMTVNPYIAPHDCTWGRRDNACLASCLTENVTRFLVFDPPSCFGVQTGYFYSRLFKTNKSQSLKERNLK